MYYYVGDFERAADRYAMAANLAPNDHLMWGHLGDAYSFSETKKTAAEVAYKRAIRLGEQLLAINVSDPFVLSVVAYYYSRIGNRENDVVVGRDDVHGTADRDGDGAT